MERGLMGNLISRFTIFGMALFVILFSTLSLAAAPGSESPQSFTYQGRFFNAAGTSALTGTVDLKFAVLNSAGTCLLYEETQSSINLGVTGNFAVGVGAGTRTASDPGLPLNQVFANSNPQPGPATPLLATSANCVGGYTPSVGEKRLLRVSVTQNGVTTVLSPNQTLSSVPQALVAETLQGVGPAGLIQVSGGVTQTNMATLTTGALSDASSLHNHDTRNDARYARIGGTSSQNFGSGDIYTSGKVGIGTTSAGADIDIEKTNPSLRLGASSGGISSIDFYSNTGGSTTASIQGSDLANTLTLKTGGTAALTINSTQSALFNGSITTAGTLGIGKYDSVTEPALITALTALGVTAMGTIWEYSTASGVAPGAIKFWDGSTAQFLSQGGVTANRALVSNGSGNVSVSSVTATELGYLSGIANTNGGLVYGNGATLKTTSAGTIGQLLTSGGVGAPTWTTSTDSNVASSVVQRDGSGNFSAGAITANLTGSVTGHASLDLPLTGATMTGTITARASSTVAGSAPIKLQTGALMGAPEAGAIEYDGANIYYTDASGVRHAIETAGVGTTSVFGRSGVVIAQANDYTWAQIDKSTSSLADITTRSAGDLSSGILLDARLSSNVALKNAANTYSVGGQQINNEGAGVVALILKEFAGQTANMLEVKDSANTLLYSIEKSGVPSASTDLTNVSYTSSAITTAGASFVQKAGSTMTGTLIGRASSTGAGTAPLKLQTGVLMTTAEVGAIEFDGTNLYITDSASSRKTIATGTINVTANRAVISDGTGGLVASATTSTEIGYLSGVANTNGGLVYGNGATLKTTSAGISGQLLTSGGVGAPTWTTSTNANQASTVVQRDVNGNFTAGTITATLSGNVTGNVTGNLTGTVTGHSTLDLPLTGGTLTGTLNFPASSVTAGTAPIKIATGTLMTNAESGAVEYDGTNLYYTTSSNVRKTLTTTTNSSQWTTTANDIYYSTGNVGIGTSSPWYKLHMKSTTTDILMGLDSATNGSSQIVFLQNGSPKGNLGLYGGATPYMALTGSSGTGGFAVNSSGNVGIGGITSPTANLHLAASTTLASTAPIKLATGVLMATAEAGAIEFDGTTLYYTNAGNTRRALSISSSAALTASKAMVTDSSGFLSTSATTSTELGYLTGITNTNGGVIYGNGGSLVTSSAGTSGQLFTSNGVAAPSWTTATDAAGASTIVKRDAAGNFAAGTITASLTGSVTGHSSLDLALTGSTMTGTITGRASTTIAGTSAIKLPTGVLMATAEAGAIEFDGTTLYYTNAGNARRALSISSSAALTASRAMVTDSSGFSSTSPTTSTELGYLSGIANTNGGMVYGNGSTLKTTAAGTSGQLLTSGGGGAPTWTTSTNANQASTIVQRDASGNFTAGTITSDLIGSLTGHSSLDLALTGGTMTGTITGRASTTVAGTAPLKISTGLLMATAESGAVEFDGTNLYYTNSSNVRKTLSTTSNSSQWVTTANDIYYTTGNVGIGTTSPSQSLQVNGIATFGSSTDGLKLSYGAGYGEIDGIDIAGSAYNDIWLKTGASAGPYLTTAGYVGVGTTAPTNPLDMRTTAAGGVAMMQNIANEGTTAGTGSAIRFKNAGGADVNIISTAPNGNANTASALQIQTKQSGGTFNTGLFMDATGNVGIGSLSPTAKLYLPASTTIAGTAPLKLATGVLMATTEAGAIEFDGTSLYYTNASNSRKSLEVTGVNLPLAGGTMTGTITGRASTTVAGTAPVKLAKGVLMATAEGGAMEYDGTNLYYTNESNSRKTISIGSSSQWTTTASNIYYTTGNVGIGTSTPANLLELKQSAASTPAYFLMSGQSDGNKYAVLTLADSSGGYPSSYDWELIHKSTHELSFTSYNGSAFTNVMSLLPGGSVGIGVASPTAKLHLPASTTLASSAPLKIATGVLMATTEAGAIEYDGTNLYYTNASNSRKTITTGVGSQWTTTATDIYYTTGNVGIGTTAPGEKLEVTGNARISGQLSTKSQTVAGGTSSVDWNNGNSISTDFNCATNVAFVNLRDGGTYTLVDTDTGTTQCSFSTTTSGTDAATVSYRFKPANAVRTASTHTVYTLMRVGTVVYISWGTGF